MLANQRAELYGDKGSLNPRSPKGTKEYRLPINDAMDAVVKQYAVAQEKQGNP
jgi:hypothetical protein